jgi:addiction module HigA family antidote
MTTSANIEIATSHPGSLIRHEIRNELGLTISEAAKRLGLRRATLHDLIEGKVPVSPEIAFRIEKVFGINMETLLTMQVRYDVDKMRRRGDEINFEVAASSGKRDQGEAAESLVLDELVRAGIPARRTPVNHPGHDIVAHPPGELPQRIQVKSREFGASTNFVGWRYDDDFDWLAVVLLNPPGYDRRVFIAPRTVVDERSHDAKFRKGRSFTVKNVSRKLAEFENNYGLSRNGDARKREHRIEKHAPLK